MHITWHRYRLDVANLAQAADCGFTVKFPTGRQGNVLGRFCVGYWIDDRQLTLWTAD